VTEIWTPGKDKKTNTPTLTHEEKEQEAIKTLLESIKLNISKVLIDEEVNSRLSKLLERIEKLGLTLESYLSSIGKTAQGLRDEYENQARSAIALDLILTKIAEEEKLAVDKKDIDAAVAAGQADRKLAKELDTPERRRFIEAILKRRKALDFITSLI
jgi:FKBP-type peptidyl-prolyl cis-trans isomerase (trigger factor)